jgi:hypothetical protein
MPVSLIRIILVKHFFLKVFPTHLTFKAGNNHWLPSLLVIILLQQVNQHLPQMLCRPFLWHTYYPFSSFSFSDSSNFLCWIAMINCRMPIIRSEDHFFSFGDC